MNTLIMDNRINRLFREKQENILSVYFTAGYPCLDDTVPVIKALEANGVDLIEIGMPFSDPVADGPVIQNSSQVALHNGMTVGKLLEQLKNIRETVKIPLILMGYLNPVVQYGVENFCRECSEIGIDGLILPDLPLNEYQERYQAVFEQYGIHQILFITPQTTKERLGQIDDASTGFIYMVSSSSTTGAKKSMSEFHLDYFQRIRQATLKHPYLIGFGISTHESFENACKFARGAIIGSAFVKALEQNNRPIEAIVSDFVRSILVGE